jgi:hypothetical protein
VGSLPRTSWACGPAPTPGSFCANPADFVPAAFQPVFNNTCASMQSVVLGANVYASNATCTAKAFPDAPFTWGGVVGSASQTCCGGNPPSSTCSGGQTSLCEDPADFMPSTIVNLGEGGTQVCAARAALFYGVSASNCSLPVLGDNSTTGAAVLAIYGRACCAGSRLNLLCGSPAPTPPPTVAPPRVGPTYPCGGSFQAWRISTAGGETCSGVPFVDATLLGGVCGSYNGTDQPIEYGFTLSNGGACLSFVTSQSCNAAVRNLQSILSTAPADQFVSLGGSGAGRCFLQQATCARYTNIGVHATITPQCGAAPSASPVAASPSPTLAPTLSPVASKSSKDSSGSGNLGASDTVAFTIVAFLVVIFIGIAVYGYQSHTSIVKNRDSMINPTYEAP